jgi:hypothetical protein
MYFSPVKRIIWRQNLVPRRNPGNQMSFKTWIKKLGFWGFLFFLVKGLLWLTVPALIAILAN